jgi:Leu/Phe-tRNA-protein transferase
LARSNKVYGIDHDIIKNTNLLENFIYKNMELNYYYSEEFSPDFYIDLALGGFISVWYKENGIEYLLPEMQFEYAVLEFSDLHISKKVQKLLKQSSKYHFFIDEYFENIIEVLSSYYGNSWIQGKYIKLLKQLKVSKYKTKEFKLVSFGILDNETKEIVAGEIGYITKSKVYTSLSGFSSKEKKYNNYGNLQLVLLAKYLEKQNFLFWNLGHPYMQYKLSLGAKILPRKEFLQKFL